MEEASDQQPSSGALPSSANSSSSVPEYLRADRLTQECKDLISTLPTAKGWIGDVSCQYQGFWYDALILQGILNLQKHFEAHDTDILLITPPRSGTIWLKALVYAIVNREQYDPITANLQSHQNLHPLLNTNPHDLVPFLELKVYRDCKAPDLSLITPPRLFSTHIPLVSLPESVKRSHCKIVYLCRDLKDTFVSFYHFCNNMRPEYKEPLLLEEAVDMFCQGNSSYGPLWKHTLDYWKESQEKPGKILFLKYEELYERPEVHLMRLADFIGYPFSQDEKEAGVVEHIIKLCSFDSLAYLDVNKQGTISTGQKSSALFRKGIQGDWKNHLTPEMASKIDQIVQQNLEGSGLRI